VPSAGTPGKERLNRFLARSGVASRRAADVLIASGQVRVNGRLPPADGQLVDPASDEVTVGGRPVSAAAPGHRYLLINKPAGWLVTARDPGGRPTVFQLIGAVATERRLFAVGRLDMDTRGLLLLTDDGVVANRLAHPRQGVEKEYVALVSGRPGEDVLARLRAGVDLEDGRTAPARVVLSGMTRGGLTEIRVVIHEGRNRQVRRMLEAVGHPVRDLRRTGFGPLRLGRLKEGDWRRLRPPEVAALQRAAGLDPT
jgi:23S rRNA pseudouridine2605 synthase